NSSGSVTDTEANRGTNASPAARPTSHSPTMTTAPRNAGSVSPALAHRDRVPPSQREPEQPEDHKRRAGRLGDHHHPADPVPGSIGRVVDAFADDRAAVGRDTERLPEVVVGEIEAVVLDEQVLEPVRALVVPDRGERLEEAQIVQV